MFESILGNEPLKAYLRGAVKQSRLPHALLFTGIDGVGKSLFARELAEKLLETNARRLENHPDFHEVRPEGKSGLHSIETLRALIDDVHAAPFEAPGKVFLIYEAERMQPAAANALLKTLEEPNLDTTLILLTSHASEILPTILSRCVRLAFHPLAEAGIAAILRGKGLPEKFAKLAQGSAGCAIDLATRPSIETPLFKLMAEKPSYPALSAALQEIEELVEDEDPVRKNRNVEHLFSCFLMWHRDQHARALGISGEGLFFPSEPEAQPKPLEAVQKAVEEARLAYQRNIKLSVCLDRLF